jgi:hypothetical protein
MDDTDEVLDLMSLVADKPKEKLGRNVAFIVGKLVMHFLH